VQSLPTLQFMLVYGVCGIVLLVCCVCCVYLCVGRGVVCVCVQPLLFSWCLLCGGSLGAVCMCWCVGWCGCECGWVWVGGYGCLGVCVSVCLRVSACVCVCLCVSVFETHFVLVSLFWYACVCGSGEGGRGWLRKA
jgi:hypothetical protein